MAEIRECAEEDFDRIVGLLGQLWPDATFQIDDLKEAFIRGIRSKSQRYICAAADSKVVGFCSLTVKNSLWQQGPLGCIDELIVDDEYREKGVGSKLLDRIMEIAKALGCRAVVLDSAFHRKDAHRFYEQRGFTKTAYLFSKAL